MPRSFSATSRATSNRSEGIDKMTEEELKGLFSLEGKVAVVTGAAGVLYSAISKALGTLGVKLAILDIREDAAKAVADEITAAGGQAIGLPCDVLKRESIETARDAVLDRFGQVDILIVLGPKELGDKERFAIDQFLMRGGAVIIAAGEYAFEPSMTGELNVNLQKTGLEELLKHYGVELEQAVVLDQQAAAFPIPVVRQLGGLRVREIRKVHYPPFLLLQGEGLSRDNPATAAVPQLVLHWASPVKCEKEAAAAGKEGQESADQTQCRTLLWSSPHAWKVPYFTAQPDFQRFPELGFKKPEKTERLPLAVSVVGKLTSYYRDKQPPVFTGQSPGKGKDKDQGGTRGSVIERAEAPSRLVVVGSANFLQDLVLQLTSQVSEAHLSDLQFVNNLVDWSVEDAALLKIRTREQYARTLAQLSTGEKIGWEVGNFLFAVLAVVLLGLVTLGRRAAAVPVIATNDDEQARSKS